MTRRKTFREIIRENESKTKWVVAAFVAIYTVVGFTFDVLLQTMNSKDSIGQALYGLVSFQSFPIITLCLVAGGLISARIAIASHEKLMLAGTSYKEVVRGNDDMALEEKQLLNIVEELSLAARLAKPPKVFIIEADFMNAFASGWSDTNAMVAISRGLMRKLNRSEIQAVLAHEIAHIKHLDIKLTLAVGAFSGTILFALEHLGDALIRSFARNRNGGAAQGVAILVMFVLKITVPIVLFLLSRFLSRTREYMADAGAVGLMREKDSLALALMKISEDYEGEAYRDPEAEIRAAAYIFSIKGDSWTSTHPSLENRLRKMGVNQYKMKGWK